MMAVILDGVVIVSLLGAIFLIVWPGNGGGDTPGGV